MCILACTAMRARVNHILRVSANWQERQQNGLWAARFIKKKGIMYISDTYVMLYHTEMHLFDAHMQRQR